MYSIVSTVDAKTGTLKMQMSLPDAQFLPGPSISLAFYPDGSH